MKKLFTPSSLTGLCAGGGILCLALRKWLLSTAVDGAGLLDHGHPGNWLSFGIAALVALILLLSVKNAGAVRMVPGKSAGFGLVIAALGYLTAGATVWLEATHPLRNLIVVAALASAICSLWMLIGMCRVKRVPALVYAPAVEGADAGVAYVLIEGKAVGKIPVVYGQTVEQKLPEETSIFTKLRKCLR